MSVLINAHSGVFGLRYEDGSWKHSLDLNQIATFLRAAKAYEVIAKPIGTHGTNSMYQPRCYNALRKSELYQPMSN